MATNVTTETDLIYKILRGCIRAEQLMAETDALCSDLDSKYLDYFKSLYKDKIRNIYIQAIVHLATAIASGVGSIGGALLPQLKGHCGLSDDTAKTITSVLEGIGKVAPEVGKVGIAFLRTGETEADGNIAVQQHLLNRIESVVKHLLTGREKLQQSFGQVQDMHHASFRLQQH